jgi:fatty acid synthase subunit beta
VINEENGKSVRVRARCYNRHRQPLLEITSEFFVRGRFNDFQNTFEHRDWPLYEFKIQSKRELEVLKVKPWIVWKTNSPNVGDLLLFRLHSYTEFKSHNEYSTLKIEGTIERVLQNHQIQLVGHVAATFHNTKSNPIEAFLKRWAKETTEYVYFEEGGFSLLPTQHKTIEPVIVVANKDNSMYSSASGDYNPIHTNVYFSELAELPTTIVHGMWTSAVVRKQVEQYAADNVSNRFKRFFFSLSHSTNCFCCI